MMRPHVFFEMTTLRNAEEALEKLRHSGAYQRYRYALTHVQSNAERFALAHSYKELLRTEFELQYAISESRSEIEHLKRLGAGPES